MKQHTIHVSVRDPKLGRKAVPVGQVPAVLSKAGGDAVPLLATQDELQRAVHQTGIGGVMVLEDPSNGEKHLGILKELQWHPVSKRLRHASFQEVKNTQVVNTSVPLRFVGEPASVSKKEGVFIKNMEHIDLHAKVTDLPSLIAIDVSGLQIGDVVTAADVQLPKGCDITHGDALICSVTIAREIVAEVEAPVEGAEPEVIGKAKEETDSE